MMCLDEAFVCTCFWGCFWGGFSSSLHYDMTI